MSALLPRFAVVVTNDPELSRWQIHDSKCGDARTVIQKGGFVDYVSAEAPEKVVANELSIYAVARVPDNWTVADYKIMPCCSKEAEGNCSA